MVSIDEKNISEEKLEMFEIAEMLCKISPKEKERIYYMLKGVALISEALKQNETETA